jgi:hypothetical protein
MDQSKAILLVIAFLSFLAVFVTVASILILSGGKVYQICPPLSSNSDSYWSFAYSAFACLRMGMSGSASFHNVRKP